MKMLRNISCIAILMVSLMFILSSSAQEKKEGEDVYTIKKGDTLWDISSKFLKDPFLWPKLWQRNPYISNPHWIYPGQSIHLSADGDIKKEEASKIVAEAKPKEAVVETEIKAPSLPPTEKKPEVSAEVKPEGKVAMEASLVEKKPPVFPERRSAGFVSDIELHGIGWVMDGKDGKNYMSLEDIVYLAFYTSKPIMIGDKYTVFRPTELIRHPVTNQKVGRKYQIAGNVQIIDQYGNFFTAKIIESFAAIVKGDLLQPYAKE